MGVVHKKVVVMKVVDLVVVVMEMADVMVVVVVDVKMEVVVEDYLMDDHICFGAYHLLDFGHRS